MPFRGIARLLAILIGFLTAIVVVLLLFLGHAFASWEVTYYVTTDMAHTTGFYSAGTYDLLKRDGYIPVYLRHDNWDFIGMYGQVALPADFPSIQFTGLYDQAMVSPLGGGGGGGAIVAVPEHALLRRLTRHLGGRYVASLVNPTLQQITTVSAATLLHAPSVGTFIVLPTRTLEVQEWCSGLTTIKWMMLWACIFGLLMNLARLRHSDGRQSGLRIGALARDLALMVPALVILAIVVGIEANVLRVVGIGYGFSKDGASWVTFAFGVSQLALYAVALKPVPRP